ncbi:MAG: hypothetical protein V9H26_03460 [Verrucomicrobiota bacterium]
MWTAATPDGPAARDQATASVNVLRASMAAVLTVGAGDGCAPLSSVEVARGSKVNYCITLLNNGEVLLSRHTITLPGLGIAQQIDHLLAPGAFVRLTAAELPALGNVTINAEQRAIADGGLDQPAGQRDRCAAISGSARPLCGAEHGGSCRDGAGGREAGDEQRALSAESLALTEFVQEARRGG